MKYEYRIINIDNLKGGDEIDIPEGSLISSKHTYPDKPDFTTTITMLVPVREGPVEM